jgi:hypothetical protein
VKVGAGIPTAFETVAAIDASVRTTQQQRLYRAVKLFAPYATAKELASGLPLFSVKSVTDGKAGFSRDSSSPYKESLAQAAARYSLYRGELATAYSVYLGGDEIAVSRIHMTVVKPASDPVVGT